MSGSQAAFLAVLGEREFLGVGRQENLHRDEIVGGRVLGALKRYKNG